MDPKLKSKIAKLEDEVVKNRSKAAYQQLIKLSKMGYDIKSLHRKMKRVSESEQIEIDEAEYMQYAGGINDLKMLADTVSTLSQTPGGIAMMLGTPAAVGTGAAAGAAALDQLIKKLSKIINQPEVQDAIDKAEASPRVDSLNEDQIELDEKRKKRKKKKKKKKAKRDACYHKVRARYDVWPSAYASGALVKCRKVGAANWGNKSKKKEGLELDDHLLQIIQEEYQAVLDEKKKKRKKRKKAGTESSKESSLRDWFGRKGAKGKKKGWVDCNAPDGKGGYKSCGRSTGEKRKKYPACRPTPGACKERGKGKSWGKKAKRKSKK
jgi:hypothetical protein